MIQVGLVCLICVKALASGLLSGSSSLRQLCDHCPWSTRYPRRAIPLQTREPHPEKHRSRDRWLRRIECHQILEAGVTIPQSLFPSLPAKPFVLDEITLSAERRQILSCWPLQHGHQSAEAASHCHLFCCCWFHFDILGRQLLT